MLLARKGYQVLVVDRATFPSDTLSTHILHPPGRRGTEAMGPARSAGGDGMSSDRHLHASTSVPFTIAGAPGTDDSPVAYCPRRTVLDKLLVDAASEAGAEVREEFTVEDVVIEDGRVVGIRGHGKGGNTVTERAESSSVRTAGTRCVAQGRRSRAVQREAADPVRLLHVLERPADRRPLRRCTSDRDGGWAVAPTHDGLTLVVAGWPYARVRGQQGRRRRELPADVRAWLPEFAERISRREA